MAHHHFLFFVGLFYNFFDTINIDLNFIPRFLHFAVKFHFIAWGNILTAPCFTVDFHLEFTAGIFENKVILAYLFDDVTLQNDVLIVFPGICICCFADGLITVDKATVFEFAFVVILCMLCLLCVRILETTFGKSAACGNGC